MNIIQHNEMISKIGRLRDNLHRSSVQEATSKNNVRGNSSNGVLQLNDIFYTKDTIVASICCETGLLLRENHNTVVPYQKVPTEDLISLFEYVVEKKQYSFVLNTELV